MMTLLKGQQIGSTSNDASLVKYTDTQTVKEGMDEINASLANCVTYNSDDDYLYVNGVKTSIQAGLKRFWFYNNGNFDSNIGGLNSQINGYHGYGGSAQMQIYHTAPTYGFGGSTNQETSLISKDSIDITPYTKMIVVCTSYTQNNSGETSFGLTQNPQYSNYAPSGNLWVDITSTGTFELNISSLRGRHYIFFDVVQNNQQEISQIYFTI